MSIEKIRNIGIIAHIDAGKTTTSERILFYTEREHKMGDVDDGTTVLDYLEEERNRGITITSAATTCHWKDYTINLIDTPGHVDFTAEVERSLRVLDGAVGVFCGVGGVEAQSETVWKQADRYHVPRIAFINKLDRVGANFDVVLQSMEKRLHVKTVVVTMPWGSESQFQGIVDILKKKAYTFSVESQGKEIIEHEVPDELEKQRKLYYEEMVNALADFDDSIIEKFSNDTLTIDDVKFSLRKATLAGKITPVLAGSSLKYKGVQFLLDAVIDYLPSPKDVESITGLNPKTGKSISIPYDDKSLTALAFKTTFDKHGELTYLRIYSGTIQEGMQVYNATRQKVERVNRLCYIHADQKINCPEANTGEIIGVIGFKDVFTGDSICRKEKPVLLESMHFPQTVVDKSVEPKTIADKDNLVIALQILSKDDPTFRFRIDEEHGQTVISGMGELHLDIICNRLQKDHKIKVSVGKPRVSYRETIQKEAQGEHLFQKEFGTKEHFAYIKVKVEPSSETKVEIVNKLPKEQVPKVYHPSIEDGIKNATATGDLAGYTLINLKVTVLEGRYNQNSSEEAFYAAAFAAVKDALSKASYILMEPIMRFQIQTPSGYLGDVISNITCRRGIIQEMLPQADFQVITGKVPIAEMFGYADKIRALTQGRGSYSLEPSEYAIVPEEIQRKLIF